MRIVKNAACACLCILLPLAPAMAGTTILSKTVKNGERFDVTLRSNPTTGYFWMLCTLPAPLMLVSADYNQPADCKAGVTGCGGDQVFSFKGVDTGTGKIELVYGHDRGSVSSLSVTSDKRAVLFAKNVSANDEYFRTILFNRTLQAIGI